MSRAKVDEFIEVLPYSLKEQIQNYVKSIDNASEEIFRSAGIKRTQSLQEKLVFIAGIKKTLSIVDSIFWLLDNSNFFLEKNETSSVKIGNSDFSRYSAFYVKLNQLRTGIFEIIDENGLSELISERMYSNIIKIIAHES